MSIYMPCAILLIIPVRKLHDDNESIEFQGPFLGTNQTNKTPSEQNSKA